MAPCLSSVSWGVLCSGGWWCLIVRLVLGVFGLRCGASMASGGGHDRVSYRVVLWARFLPLCVLAGGFLSVGVLGGWLGA